MTAEVGTEGMLDEALLHLGSAAVRPGCTGGEVAAEARAVVASWWLDVQAGGTPPERLHLLVGELRRWCLLAARQEELAWDRLERAGSSLDACRAGRRAVALRQAAEELRPFE